MKTDIPLYNNLILVDSILVTPSELNQNLYNVILKKLQYKVEGKCLKDGFVRPNSIKIINRKAGTINPAHFTGDVKYNITYSADVCHPIQNQIIECIVNMVGKPGVQAYVENKDKSPLYIMLSKTHHLNNKYFTTIKEGDKIRVRVVNSEFNFNEEQIRVLAILENTKPTDTHTKTEENSNLRKNQTSHKLVSKLSKESSLSDDSSSEDDVEVVVKSKKLLDEDEEEDVKDKEDEEDEEDDEDDDVKDEEDEEE
jgi:DNA-directed RNA polymerase subunit E'/Rpb7